MPDAALIAHIEERLVRAGLDPPRAVHAALATYVEALAKWNARINLTAYSLDRPTDEAIDRLIVEPVALAQFVGPDDRLAIDVGSGGGSPALPFRLVAQQLELTLVESRLRKAAFLREATRLLGLKRVTVDNRRLEELAKDANQPASDIVTMRAVRPDEGLCEAIRTLLRPGGRFFWLTSEGALKATLPGFRPSSIESLLPESTSRLVVMTVS